MFYEFKSIYSATRCYPILAMVIVSCLSTEGKLHFNA